MSEKDGSLPRLAGEGDWEREYRREPKLVCNFRGGVGAETARVLLGLADVTMSCGVAEMPGEHPLSSKQNRHTFIGISLECRLFCVLAPDQAFFLPYSFSPPLPPGSDNDDNHI